MNKLQNAIKEALVEKGYKEADEISQILTKNKVFSKDKATWDSSFTIKKYANQEDYEANREYSQEESYELFGTKQTTKIEKPGNLLLNDGITVLLNLLTTTGSSPTAYSSANTYIGVGDSSTAEAASQTGLQATTNKLWKAMDSTYPQVSGQTATWQATFTGAEANFAWNEFTIVNASTDSGTNLCRKVSAQGTKVVDQVWTIVYTVTLS